MEGASAEQERGASAAGVHVWIVSLTDVDRALSGAERWLSAEELARCNRRGDAAARARFIVSRALLRRVLGEHLRRAPQELAFVRGQRGKPVVADAPGLDFSFSDCREAALIALAGTAVGVDAEHERTPRRAARTAHRIFHPETAAALEELSPEHRAQAFLQAWTVREAHVKAVGGGLFHTPDVLPFDAAVPADGRPRLVRDRLLRETWSVARFRPTPTAYGALVARGSIDTLYIHGAATALALLEEDPT